MTTYTVTLDHRPALRLEALTAMQAFTRFVEENYEGDLVLRASLHPDEDSLTAILWRYPAMAQPPVEIMVEPAAEAGKVAA